MFDVMEKRITLVEPLGKTRQPFKQMDVIYLISPTQSSVRQVVADFDTEETSKYADVHLYFLEKVPYNYSQTNKKLCKLDVFPMLLQITPDLIQLLQTSPYLINRIKTLKEVNINFLSLESNVFHLDSSNALSKMHGSVPDPAFPLEIAKQLATVCITLNECPVIRYQGTSRFAHEIAFSFNQIITEFRNTNRNNFWTYGDEGHTERERGQLLILDRSFDTLSPLLHEYTYQAMIQDLLPIADNVFNYDAETNAGERVNKTVLLNEHDALWVEFRHLHIAKVISLIKERMSDIIQNNGAASLSKNSGTDMSITSMAAAVKELPEYRETVSKLSQHVYLTQQCMDFFNSANLLEISQLEQMIATGSDDDGKDVKPQLLFRMLCDKLKSPKITKLQKIRLMAVYLITQRNITKEERMQLAVDSQLNGGEQQILRNFDRFVGSAQSVVADSTKSSSLLGKIFKGKSTPKHAPTPEGEYADTRHACELRHLLEHLIGGNLPADKYPSFGGTAAPTYTAAVAKSVRRATNNVAKNVKKEPIAYSGGRYIIFVAGGITYSEMKAAYEVMAQNSKEVIVGSTHVFNPDTFVKDIAALDPDSANAIAGL